ncbi:hypothetical protein FACS1894208_11390 [Clostridia bacterium]|nr:hypothetical protein FACS1894208_11390 [Clostridia bacterium]
MERRFLYEGTFFTLLLRNTRLQFPKELGKKTDYTEADIMKDMILIVNTSFKITNSDSFGKTVPLYQSCQVAKSKVVPITDVTIVTFSRILLKQTIQI